MAVVVVTGVPRSGTSMMMKMLESGGVPCFYEQVVNEFNPGGFYESRAGMQAELEFLQTLDGQAVKVLQNLPHVPAGALDARMIIMRRDLTAALDSSNRVAALRGLEPRPASYRDFLQGDLDAIRLWCADQPHIEVWYDDVRRNTANECLRVRRLVGVDLDLAAMASVVRYD